MSTNRPIKQAKVPTGLLKSPLNSMQNRAGENVLELTKVSRLSRCFSITGKAKIMKLYTDVF